MILEKNKKDFLEYSEDILKKIFLSIGIIMMSYDDKIKDRLINIGKKYYEAEEATEYFIEESEKELASIFASKGIFMRTCMYEKELLLIGKKYKELKKREII